MLEVHCEPVCEGMMSQKIEITRYPNRRLYDRNQKKYVTLGDLESMVLDGHDVRVTDNKSNEDLTRSILVQILIERHPERLELFPIPFLQELLRADQMGLDWLKLYLSQAKAVMDGLNSATPNSVFPGMDVWQSMMPWGARPSPRRQTDHAAPDHTSPTDEESSRDDQGGDDRGRDELAAKLAELEARLRQLEGTESKDSS